MEKKHFSVAHHHFTIKMPHDNKLWHCMQPYTPFEITASPESIPLFNLEVKEQLENLSEFCLIGEYQSDMVNLKVSKANRKLLVEFKTNSSAKTTNLVVDNCWNASVVLDKDTANNLLDLNNILMLLYTLSTSLYNTLLLHASVVEQNGKGYIFLGKSGTGKSTHSRLWVENITGSSLLNDDNPVVRIINGIPMVYGSPWSGKTSCYQNKGVEIKGIVRIVQAPENRIVALNTVKSYASVLPSCSCARWNANHTREIHQTIEQLITMVNSYNLECLPNANAAMLCYKKVQNDKNHCPLHFQQDKTNGK